MSRILGILAILVGLVSCTGNPPIQAARHIPQSGVLEVLYFHGRQRCPSCQAIEQLTRQVVDSLHNKVIVLRVIDISQPQNQAIADQYEVTWSALKLAGNGKVVDLTKLGFGYARHNPAEFKHRLTEYLIQMLK